jgi:hypothetical protein
MSDEVRRTLDSAYAELASEQHLELTAVRDKALELAGHGDGSTFSTDQEEINAVAALALGLRAGTVRMGEAMTQQDADSEVMRLAASYDGLPGMPRWDPHEVAAVAHHPDPAAPLPGPERQPVTLTSEQAAERDRLLALSNELRSGPSRPQYGAALGGPVPGELVLSQQGGSDHVSDSEILAATLGQRKHDPDELALSERVRPADIAHLTAAQVNEQIVSGHLVLARAPNGALILARGQYHGGPGSHTVTSNTRAHCADDEDYEDASDDLEGKLQDIRDRHPDLFRQAGDPARGKDPSRAGNARIGVKSQAQRARERRASRPGHTSGAV